MTLSEWIIKQGGEPTWFKSIERHLRAEVIKEVSSVNNWDAYCEELRTNAKFTQKHVYSFVVLDNGYAVGLNENPAIGFTFPVIRYGR